MKINFKIAILALLTITATSCSSLMTPKVLDSSPGTTGNAQSLIRVTSDPIPEFYPQLSPDGSKLIFHTRDNTKTGNEKWSVVMMNVGQPGRIPLVGSYTLSPSFFPDNKTILYSYVKPSKPVIAKSMTDGSAGINYISPNSMGDFDQGPRVSPSGKKIVFFTKFGDTYQLCTMDITGMNPSILAEGSNPNWHPSGEQLIYTKNVGKFSQIFTYDFKSGQSTQLTSGEFSSEDPSFSKDGKYIVFSSDRDAQNDQIFIMNAAGSNVTQLTTGKVKNGMPIFAPNNTIYFCSNAGSKTSNIDWFSSDVWSLVPILQ